MSESKSSGMDGCSFLLVMLQILFVGLKLTHYIDWSWWWVLSPMIFVGICTILVLLLLVIVAIIKG